MGVLTLIISGDSGPLAGPVQAGPLEAEAIPQIRSELQGYDVFGLRALLPFADGELNLLSFFQGPPAGALNGPEMNKNILFAFTGDEPVALRVVEPLNGSNYRF